MGATRLSGDVLELGESMGFALGEDSTGEETVVMTAEALAEALRGADTEDEV